MINDNFYILDLFDSLKEDYSNNLFYLGKNVVILSNNVYFLEKNFNSKVFPFNNSNDFELIKILSGKEFLNNNLIIFTKMPNFIKPFDKIDDFYFNEINNFFFFLINSIRSFLFSFKKDKDINIFIILHRNFNNKISLWSVSEYINNSLISLMNTLNLEFKNFNNLKINCISTENIKVLYKKNIYPYRSFFSNKKKFHLNDIIFFIKKNNFNNKIIKI